jgi:aminocarboxymuconate-semialdehyde decarboxylase
MLKIDTHAHILPRDWPNLAAKYGDDRFPVMTHTDGRHRIYKDGKFFREVWESRSIRRHRIDDYARFGVDVQVISTVPVLFSYWARAYQALELHRHLNDHMAGSVPRFIRALRRHRHGAAAVASLAIRELERCIDELGLQGVQIGSHCNEWNLDAPELFPFFEAAADLGAAVLVHPWDMMGGHHAQVLDAMAGRHAGRAIARRVLPDFGGVLERLPKLRVMLAHGGGSFPWTIGRIEHGFRMRPDLVATDNPRNPREYLKRLYFDSCVHDAGAALSAGCDRRRARDARHRLSFPAGGAGTGQRHRGAETGRSEPRPPCSTARRWSGWGLPLHRFVFRTGTGVTHEIQALHDPSLPPGPFHPAAGIAPRRPMSAWPSGSVHFSTPSNWLGIMQVDGDPEVRVFQVPDPSPPARTTRSRASPSR